MSSQGLGLRRIKVSKKIAKNENDFKKALLTFRKSIIVTTIKTSD
ncbi:hypothetical protein HMPREF5505_0298 [Lactobacillus delbrueckii subsp. lactis DSM 20072]|nr:hypothetical protein HMPREF5505_0298 [Lactobacillus delbrueckii subsp. lactis DSM 20072]